MSEKLEINELNLGRKKAIENAEELLEEAEILFVNNKYHRALYLSYIASEEIGKYIYLCSMIIRVIHEENVNWKKFWKKYRNHQDKSTILLLIEDVVLNLDNELSEEHNPFKQSEIQEIIKLSSLYSDYSNNVFCKPSDMDVTVITKQLIKLLRGRVKHFKENYKNTSSEEFIKLFTKETISNWYSQLGIKDHVE